MKKKRIFWIVIIFTFFLCGMKCEAKERTLYRDKAQLFQKMRDIFQGGGPLNDFTYYDPEVDLATYDCDAPMLLPPGGGSYTFAQTNMTDIMKIEIETIPSGWSVPVIKYPVTSLQVVIPDKVVSDEYELTLRVWIYDYTGVFLEVQRIDMYIEVGAYTTDCSIEVLDADTGEPISGALVEGEMGYLEGENKRGFTDTDGIAYFIDMDNYYNHTRDIVIEATGYEPLQVSVSTWLDEEHIYRSYSLKPRSKTGRLTVLVSDVFGDVGGADVYISNGRLVDDHYETYPDGGDAVTDRINPGTYHVVISKQGYQTAEFDVEMLEDGSDKRVKQQLIHDRTATLILHINDSSGNGISGAVADINHTIFEAGNDGTLVLEYIPLGEHMLAVRAEGYITREKRIYFREETEMSICLKETKTAPLMREYDYNHAAISAGYGHTVYIGKDNRAYGTGSNEYGQLTGTGSVKKNKYITDDVIMTASGYSHQLFLKRDGTVWACGSNSRGQLGDGTEINRSVLTQVPGLDHVVQIAANRSFSIAVKDDGTAWGWGDNSDGQLGIDSTDTKQASPVKVALTDVIQAACGEENSYFIKKDGSAYACGNNSWGQLGTGTTESSSRIPKKIALDEPIRRIAGGYEHAVAIDQRGFCYSWGLNIRGQFGTGKNKFSYTPVQCPYLSGIRSVAAGYNFTIFCDEKGDVYQCGLVGMTPPEGHVMQDFFRPVQLEELKGIQSVAAGRLNVLAQEADGTIWRWGRNSDGELGNGATEQSLVPIRFASEQALGSNTVPSIAEPVPLEQTESVSHVSICRKGEYRYYRFVAPGTGTYAIRSVSSSGTDPCAYLLDNTNKQLAYNDDAPAANKNPDNTRDFYISQTLKAGHIYYVKTKLLSSTKTGSFDLVIACPDEERHSVFERDNPALYRALRANNSDLDKENTGEITPAELDTLRGSLFLSGRGITDVTGLENCGHISQLYLDRNSITDISPLAELNLTALDVSDNQLTDVSAVANMKKLNVLLAARNQITDIQGITGLKSLNYLYLEENKITDVSLLGTNPKLRYLTIQNNQLAGLDGLERCKDIRQINVSGNSDITALEPLERLWELQDLRISDTNVTTLDYVPNNRYEHLYLSGSRIDEKEKEQIQKNAIIGDIVY